VDGEGFEPPKAFAS